jgi:chromosome segregation ATPase
MSDKAIRIQVLFAALDRLGSPLRQLSAGSRGLTKDLAATQRQLAGLKKSQQQVAQFRGAEGRFQKSTAELEGLRAKTAAVRQEMEKAEGSTKKLAGALRAAEKAEAAAAARTETHGTRLQELSRGLEAAGVDVSRLAEHEDRLAHRMRDTNKQLDTQRDKLARIQRVRERGEKVPRSASWRHPFPRRSPARKRRPTSPPRSPRWAPRPGARSSSCPSRRRTCRIIRSSTMTTS